MNKLISDVAKLVKVAEEQNYAVIVADGKDRYGFFNVSTPKHAEESLKKLATNDDNIPQEIIVTAMGVINTMYMSKTGSEWPLFMNVEPIDDNVLNNDQINWDNYELIQKNANREGIVFGDTFLPLDTKSNVKAASDLLASHHDKFGGIDRVKFASKISTQATKFGIKVGDVVEKYAYGTLNPDFYELMDNRINVAKDYSETRTLLENIKTDASSMSTNKVAEALEVTDRMLPFSMKFAAQIKMGSDRPMFYSGINVPDAFNTVYGVQIRPKTLVEKIANISDEKLAIHFSDVFIEQLRESPKEMIDRATSTVMTTLRNIV